MEFNAKPFKLCLGYYLSKSYRGKGIVPLCVSEMCRLAFEEIPGILRVDAAVFKHNKASARVLEKVGFQNEGTLRNYYLKNGVALDAVMYSLVKGDWPVEFQKNRKKKTS